MIDEPMEGRLYLLRDAIWTLLLHCHLFGHPQAHTAPNKPEPYHEIVRPVALEFGDGVS
jgi:hypothetical protein